MINHYYVSQEYPLTLWAHGAFWGQSTKSIHTAFSPFYQLYKPLYNIFPLLIGTSNN